MELAANYAGENKTKGSVCRVCGVGKEGLGCKEGAASLGTKPQQWQPPATGRTQAKPRAH